MGRSAHYRVRYYVYILASRSRSLYVGVTRDLARRLLEHRHACGSHVARYRINRLVYFEETPSVRSAIAREKEIKRWTRAKKVTLIETVNAGWLDLARDWVGVSGEENAKA